MTGDIEVILADGYYNQTQTFALNEKDGGTNQHYVVYRHEGEGEAVIGGKRDITGFTVYDTAKNIYVADAADPVSYTHLGNSCIIFTILSC